MPLARVTSEVWKRVILWVIILILSSIIVIGYKDYMFMDEQMRFMKHGIYEGIIGSDYCNGEDS